MDLTTDFFCKCEAFVSSKSYLTNFTAYEKVDIASKVARTL